MNSYLTHNEVTALEFGCCSRKNKEKRRKQQARLPRQGLINHPIGARLTNRATSLQPQFNSSDTAKTTLKIRTKTTREDNHKIRRKNLTVHILRRATSPIPHSHTQTSGTRYVHHSHTSERYRSRGGASTPHSSGCGFCSSHLLNDNFLPRTRPALNQQQRFHFDNGFQISLPKSVLPAVPERNIPPACLRVCTSCPNSPMLTTRNLRDATASHIPSHDWRDGEDLADDSTVYRRPTIPALVTQNDRSFFSSTTIFATDLPCSHREEPNPTMATQSDSLPARLLSSASRSPDSTAAALFAKTRTSVSPTPPRSPTDSTYCGDVQSPTAIPRFNDCEEPVFSSGNPAQGPIVTVDSKPVAQPETNQHFQPTPEIASDVPPWAAAVQELKQRVSLLETDVAFLIDQTTMLQTTLHLVRDENTALNSKEEALRDEMHNLLEEIEDLYDDFECCLPFIRDYSLTKSLLRPLSWKRKRDDPEDDGVEDEEPDAKRHKACHVIDDDEQHDGW
jgi:hypothetical protein